LKGPVQIGVEKCFVGVHVLDVIVLSDFDQRGKILEASGDLSDRGYFKKFL